jgi:hypothetical protein
MFINLAITLWKRMALTYTAKPNPFIQALRHCWHEWSPLQITYQVRLSLQEKEFSHAFFYYLFNGIHIGANDSGLRAAFRHAQRK